MLVLALVVAAVAAVRGLWSPCGLSMLSSLNPISEAARGNRFATTAAWYLSGAAVGGALLGTGCAVLAAGVHLLPAAAWWRWPVAAVAALVCAAADSPALRLSLPVHPRQVDERWLNCYRRWIYAAGFGVQIGTGFATYIMSATVYLAAGLAALTGSVRGAFVVGLAFGTVRGLGILLVVRVRDADVLRRLLGTLDRLEPASSRATCAVSIAVAGSCWIASTRHVAVAALTLGVAGVLCAAPAVVRVIAHPARWGSYSANRTSRPSI